MAIDTLNPTFELAIMWDSQNLYGTGKDSIDIDGDGGYDMIFSCSLLNADSIHLLNGQEPDPYPYFKVEPRNGYLIQCTEETISGLGSVYWVDALQFNAKITENELWSSIETFLWKENGTPGIPSFGPWYALDDTRYIAFNRLNKLGWIKLDPLDHEHIKINIIAYEI